MSKTILLIDDDPDILVSTSSILKKRGFAVLESRTAEEALDILKNAHPDLILTDVLLPQMNGYELVKQIKECSFTKDIPVLVITGRGQMKESFDAIGANGFIQKPFSPDDLVGKIAEIFHISEILLSDDRPKRRKILVLGRKNFSDIQTDICDVVAHLGCDVFSTFSVSEAVAKAVDFSPDIFIVDVQLDGKHSAEFVNIIRHLPSYEEKPVIGYCYYKLNEMGEDTARKKILQIHDDAQKFLSSGGSVYLDRYIRVALIEALMEFMKKT